MRRTPAVGPAIAATVVALLGEGRMVLASTVTECSPGERDPSAPEVGVRYFSHSGVAVETPGELLVFDYVGPHAEDGPRSTGTLGAADLADRSAVVFVSHVHDDHFDPIISTWALNERLHYVVSSDVPETAPSHAAFPQSRRTIVGPYEQHRIEREGRPDLLVRTTRSTDAGVAFRVEIGGLTVYHSGDLALWAWDDSGYDAMRDTFLAELERLGRADLAFVCADLRPRGRGRLTGAVDAIRTLRPRVAFAIHNRGRQREAGEVLAARVEEAGLDTIVPVVATHGQCFVVDLPAPPRVRIATELGDIVVAVFEDRAPVTAANFLRYVDENRYANASFYRVVTPHNQPGDGVKIEVIQGGIGIVESPERLPSIEHETTEDTGVLHTDGAVSMARREPGTASSELFICVGDQPELDYGGRRNPDGQGFAAFGQVLEGMGVVRAIQRRPEERQMLASPVRIVSVTRISR